MPAALSPPTVLISKGDWSRRGKRPVAPRPHPGGQPPLENHGQGPAQLCGRQGSPVPRAALASLHRTAGGALDDHALGLPLSMALRAPSRLLLMQEPPWKLISGER